MLQTGIYLAVTGDGIDLDLFALRGKRTRLSQCEFEDHDGFGLCPVEYSVCAASLAGGRNDKVPQRVSKHAVLFLLLRLRSHVLHSVGDLGR